MVYINLHINLTAMIHQLLIEKVLPVMVALLQGWCPAVMPGCFGAAELSIVGILAFALRISMGN